MAYLLTAIMTGGVAAILALLAGQSLGSVIWTYIVFGHLGMASLGLAALAAALGGRLRGSDTAAD